MREQPRWIEGIFEFRCAGLLALVLCLIGACRHHCQAEGRLIPAVVVIYQSGHKTTGAVVRADERGTWVLTCKHGRRPSDEWRAAGLRGTKTIPDRDADLALLWTRDRWYGRPLEISPYPPIAPVRWTNDGQLSLLYAVQTRRYPGESGLPLLTDGRVCGVLRCGGNGQSFYTRHDDLLRFVALIRK